MQKIPTLFVRDESTHQITDLVMPGCEWVPAGEGVATRKWDGTCCLVRDGKLFKRCEWDAKKGAAPASFLHWDFDPSQRSGHGWIPVGDDPGDWMHRAGFVVGSDDRGEPFRDGTYELIGPKIGKNPEHVESPILVPHGRDTLDAPRTFAALRDFLKANDIEGIVWHHPSGRMAKIKGRDFGIKRR